MSIKNRLNKILSTKMEVLTKLTAVVAGSNCSKFRIKSVDRDCLRLVCEGAGKAYEKEINTNKIINFILDNLD